jgi:iron complex outermembrane recepter protein
LSKYYLCILLIVLSINAKAQLAITGTLVHEHDSIGIAAAQIIVEENNSTTITDALGKFALSLPQGSYHITINVSGAEPLHWYIPLNKDTNIVYYIEQHNVHQLSAVTVSGVRQNTDIVNKITQKEIAQNIGNSITDIVSTTAGVQAIKSGAGVAKPIIHGLTGNRIGYLLSGITINGQKWGADHEPELDGNASYALSIAKGTQAVQYADNSLGAYIIAEPLPITKDPHLHTSLTTAWQSNGRQSTISIKMQQYSNKLAWRIHAGGKLGGDRHTPLYYLSNTGRREYNISAYAMPVHKNLNLSTKILYTLFSAKLGVLQASHLGNLTDLATALQQATPLYTNSQFSFTIAPPWQQVTHHFASVIHTRAINNNSYRQYVLNMQLNSRQEYDIRRGNRSHIPVLNMQLHTYQMEYLHHTSINKHTTKYGMQFKNLINNNGGETGILPLITNYWLSQLGAFYLQQFKNNNWQYDYGLRCDALYWLAYPYIGNSSFGYFNTININTNANIGVQYNSHLLQVKLNNTYIVRAPEANERFSIGLHQGVSAIEEGNIKLKSERAFKSLLQTNIHNHAENLFIEVQGYTQWVNNYIYLYATGENRLTIRGAYPVFKYTQTMAHLYGADALVNYTIVPSILLQAKASAIRIKDVVKNETIIFTPADRVQFKAEHTIKIGKNASNISTGITWLMVAKQHLIRPLQDIASTPNAYNLLGLAVQAKILVQHKPVLLMVHVDNVANTQYRDYLNRLRYYALDEGRNIRLSMKIDL